MNFCSCKGGCHCKSCVCSSYATFFDTLSNQNRLHIMNSLRKGPKNVSQILEETGLEQTAVSHSLKRLEQCGFVSVKKKGKFHTYTLNSSAVEPLLKLLDKHMVKP